MLEGLVANLLNRFLGLYVQNFDAKQLNVGIWSGDVKLRNLELRREALDQFRLPLNVVEGHLGQLTLSIPWSNLKGKPVRVNIEDVFLLAAPKEDAEYDPEEEERRAHAVKMEKLESAELLKERSTEGLSQEEQQKTQSFTESLVTAIVDNLQVTIKNIHIRYEDSISAAGHPFALGLTLQEFSAVSTDADWKPTFIQTTSGTTHKLASLDALAMYWDTDSSLLGTGTGGQVGAEAQGADHEDLMNKFREMIVRADSPTIGDHQFVLKPVSGRAGLEMDKTGKLDRPKLKARLLFDELGFILDEDQYRDALMMVDLFHYFVRHQEYRKLQPKASPKEDPKAWLKFAGDAVLSKIHERNRRWTWSYFKERRDDRVKYIALFKKKKKDEKFSPAELEDYNALERKLTYEDLRFWRSLARNQLRKENIGTKKPAQQSSGWTSWVWGSKQQKQETTEEEGPVMTEQQRKELYEAIDWDEKKTIAESVSLPRESIKLQVETSLRTGSFTLKRNPHGNANEILHLVFDAFSAKFFQRPDSFLAQLSLGGMRLYDGTTADTLFPQIVRVKAAGEVPDQTISRELSDEEDALNDNSRPTDPEEDPFFQLQFEQHPLDESADSALMMKLKSMEIIYNPQFIVEIAKFFKPPQRHMESVGALMETAGATVEGIRQQTRAGLEFALEEHKTINAQLDLQAPLIIIPESVKVKDCQCLIFDAGHVSLSSELVDKETLREIQSKQKQQYSDEDYKRLEGLMYDKFLLRLDSTQVLIGPSIHDTKRQLKTEDDTKNLHIIDRINMDFVIENSIVPKATDLTRFKISGHLPVLHASVSDAKYKNLMRLIDVAIPKLGEVDELPFDNKERTAVKPTTSQGAATVDASSRQRSTSFQFSAQQREILLEEDETDNEGSERFEETSPGKPDANIVARQRNFEFKFTVDRLQGSLFRSDPDGEKPDQLLVELVAEHFQFDFYQRPFDMVAEVLLRSLSIEDNIEEDPRAEFKNIISSEGADSSAPEDLIHVKFTKVKPESPTFMTEYEGIETNLEAAISTINVVVTRKTLLTLLDFVLVTFTDQSSPPRDKAGLPQEDGAESEHEKELAKEAEPQAGKIKLKVKLQSIVLILNNDGVRLATMSLNTADVGIFLMGKAMRIGARLGDLSLIDDINQGASTDSPLRQLVTIQGDELADFSYETFDADSPSYPGYDSSVFLRSGSIKVNFLTEPFRKIIDFFVKFGKMQAIFNAARQAAANQASQIQETANKMHFDILVRTPILVFPRVTLLDKPQRDLLTAYLGEIYANNKFVPLDDSSEPEVVNHLSAGVRNIRLTSDFHYEDDLSEELELIDKVDIDFKVNYTEHKPGAERPDLEIEGAMSDINLRLTDAQLKFLLELSRSVPAAFAADPEQDEREAVKELPDDVVQPAKAVAEANIDRTDEGPVADLGPELGTAADSWTKLDFVFKVKTIGLELLLGPEGKPVGDLNAASLTKFSLNNTHVKLRMVSDGSLESELLIHSFTVKDSRAKETNKFRKIMSLINNDVKQQFMASVSISGGKERNLIAMLTIDSPRIIFAIDYLFALQSFLTASFASDQPADLEGEGMEEITADEAESALSAQSDAQSETPNERAISHDQPKESGSMSISFRANIVDAQVILIANPSLGSSEAIVLGTKQILMSQQHALTLQVLEMGMFLCRMDQFETNRLRILDDFSIHMSMDTRSQGKNSSLTSIHVDIEPLVLRLSLRDILLALQIVNKASELSSKDQPKITDTEPKKLKEIKGSSTIGPKRKSLTAKRTSTVITKSAKSAATHQTALSSRDQSAEATAIMKREELTAEIQGIRVVLIGDLHELPLLDWSIRNFNVSVRDWSGAMSGDTNIDMFVNIYNFSKSAWEPLIEPWQLGFHMSKDQNPDRLSVELYSRKMLELTVTAATIALASKSAQFLSTDEDVLAKPRGSDAPYKVRNHTGFAMNIWAESGSGDEASAAKLSDGEESPWRFEDPTAVRENLSPEGGSGIVGIKLEGSGFDSIDRIPVNREGETLYNLKPRKDKILHRLLVDVRLGSDNVKYITFRSPLLVENKTQIPVEIGVYSPEDGHLLKIEKILPGEGRPAPVGAAFMHSLTVRPDQGFGYTWSNERLYWRDLLKRPIRTITCCSEGSDQNPPFYFQMSAIFDKNDPLTSVYPYMKIRLSAPIELQNLLPYDFKYRIYDKNTKKDWTNFLRKGGVSPVHVIELSHLLLMSIHMEDTVFKQSEFSIINSPNQDDFRREDTITVKDAEGLPLRLKLHYYNIPDSGGAFKVAVYSPYLVLNKTGLDLNIRSKSLLGSAKSAAGQNFNETADRDARRVQPYMFSYPTDDRKNRALIKVGDTGWSKPQSFEAIGSTFDVALPSQTSKTEMHIGVSVDEGEGKYNLTKVVTLAPRFILKNKLNEDLNIREPGSSEVMTISPGGLLPLRFLRQGVEKQLCLCFPGMNNQWSSPFFISNVGSVHVKIAKAGQRQRLIRVEILMEKSTIFLHLSLETKHWPFSMRNESDTEFMFYQSNPNLDEDEEDRGSGWRPIRYRLPPRSIMPYAWDYPAAKSKEIIISANGRERHVKLAEIGNLLPMKVPIAKGSPQQKTIDLNVAAEGPTQTLILSNYNPSKSLYKQNSAKSSQASVATGFEVKEIDTDVTFRAQLRFSGLGISLVNKHLKELLYLTFREIEVKYSESKLYQTLNSTIKWIQIDNQLYGGIFPILLYPSVVPKTGKEMEAHPIFHTMVTRVKDDSYGVLYIKYFTVLLQQMTLEIDEDFIFAMLDFAKIPGASWAEERDGKLCDDHLDIPEPQQEQHGQDVYFELLHLQPAQLDLSFVRTERINAEDTMANSNPMMFFVNVMTMSIGNVNDAPVRLNALMLENARVSIPALMQNIQSHYTQEVIRQIHIILGSADFLGNPVGLFNNVSSGVADIFYEPYQGLVMTDRPQELGIGIAKGASSFVKKSVFGFSDSMAKFTGSMSKGLAAATLDKEYQDQRRMSKSRNRPKHALYGVTTGGNAFATSLASGVGGLARHPLQGAEKEGLPGFVKGVGKGFLGLATKPAIGAFDLASSVAEGVRNTTTVFDQEGLDRVRLTRFIGQDGIVRPYSQREALGQFWLKTLDNGKYFTEDYIAHLELSGKELFVMLTYNRIMLVKAKKLQTEWDVPLKDIQTISKERTGLCITLKGGTNGPFVPVQDESSRNWIYRQIAIAVNAYNDKWNAKG
ncbi:vacuolar protein sorting-associated protein 13 [Xylona heveae TC161]|uniref:Vacuolar protein sorting-associated protein n=1 Tax=Xylona heveae (strain CBS 132557 / TC161) TaxID=1328760 RepID=A0A165IFR3_XYLHT|nr:vacuolar protein sorting-associated protein 13 [Xylona heveae TC161]KZF24832.1 vacuolar protein sorting-associated protein 13 [Xylona heveae TC161]